MDTYQGICELGWREITNSFSIKSNCNLAFHSIMNLGDTATVPTKCKRGHTTKNAERSGTAHRPANYRMHQATHFLEERVRNFL
jgi:hypothetical protein